MISKIPRKPYLIWIGLNIADNMINAFSLTREISLVKQGNAFGYSDILKITNKSYLLRIVGKHRNYPKE